MAERVEIGVDGKDEAFDLIRALAVRGLPASVRGDPTHPAVVLELGSESTERLLADLLPALEAWRLDRVHEPLTLEVGGRLYWLDSRAELTPCAGEAAASAVAAARAA